MPNVMAYNNFEGNSSTPGGKTQVTLPGYFLSPISGDGFQMNIFGFIYQRG